MPSRSVFNEREAGAMMRVDPEYLRWGVLLVSALGAWRFLPLAAVRLMAAFTRDEARHRRCMEVLRLARRDAAQIPSYTSPLSPWGAADTAASTVTSGKLDPDEAVHQRNRDRARRTVQPSASSGQARSRRQALAEGPRKSQAASR
jgi:hypothetical protein